jgi:hypothetical protein
MRSHREHERLHREDERLHLRDEFHLPSPVISTDVTMKTFMFTMKTLIVAMRLHRCDDEPLHLRDEDASVRDERRPM